MSAGVIAAHYVAGVGGGPYATAIQGLSPLLYLRLGETSGTTANDSSGNGRNGTYVNTPTLNASSLTLDGDLNPAISVNSNSGSCASVASGTWMDVPSITVAGYVRLSSGTDATNGDAFVSRYTAAGGNNWLLWRNTAGQWAVQARNTSGTAYNVNGAAVTVGAAYHVAFTWGGGFLTLYVNGLQVGRTAVVGNLQTGTSPIEVARYSQANTTTPTGVFDEVAVFSGALSAAQILALAVAGSRTYIYDTSGSFLCPAGVTAPLVECYGAGGGGGSSNAITARGGGGQGAYAASNPTLTPGNSYAIGIGVGGAGSVGAGAGAAGTSTTFASTTVVAAGGQGSNSITGGAGGTTAASTGTTKVAGAAGANSSGNNGGAGGGPGTILSGGTGGAGGPGAGLSGSNGGAPGAGGGGTGRSPAANGGNGADGRVVITIP